MPIHESKPRCPVVSYCLSVVRKSKQNTLKLSALRWRTRITIVPRSLGNFLNVWSTDCRLHDSRPAFFSQDDLQWCADGTALQYFVVNNMQIPTSLLQNFRPFFPERFSLCVKAQIGKSSCKSVRQIPLSLKNANWKAGFLLNLIPMIPDDSRSTLCSDHVSCDRLSNSHLLRARAGNYRRPRFVASEDVMVRWPWICLQCGVHHRNWGSGIRAQPQWTEILGVRASATASDKPGTNASNVVCSAIECFSLWHSSWRQCML